MFSNIRFIPTRRYQLNFMRNIWISLVYNNGYMCHACLIDFSRTPIDWLNCAADWAFQKCFIWFITVHFDRCPSDSIFIHNFLFNFFLSVWNIQHRKNNASKDRENWKTKKKGKYTHAHAYFTPACNCNWEVLHPLCADWACMCTRMCHYITSKMCVCKLIWLALLLSHMRTVCRCS